MTRSAAEPRPRYTVTAERDAKVWFLRVRELDGVVTQARRLDQAEKTVRSLLALWLKVPRESFDVEVLPVLDPSIQNMLDRVYSLRTESARLSADAQNLTAGAAFALVESGFTVRDVGKLLDLSFQRAAQLAAKGGASS